MNTSLLIIGTLVVLLIVIITINLVKINKAKKRAINANTIAYGVIKGFDSMIKNAITNSLSLIILTVDAILVFGTAALTKDSYNGYGAWAYMLAFLVAVIPFLIANYFVLIFSDRRAVERWHNKFINAQSVDYVRDTNSDEGQAWQYSLSKMNSLPRRIGDEYLQDKLQSSHKAILIFLVGVWIIMQAFISRLAYLKVFESTGGEATNSEYLIPFTVIGATIALDIIYVFTAMSIMAKMEEIESGYLDLLFKTEGFNDIVSYADMLFKHNPNENKYGMKPNAAPIVTTPVVNKPSVDTPEEPPVSTDAAIIPVATPTEEPTATPLRRRLTPQITGRRNR